MKFPMPPKTGYVRPQLRFTTRREKWWHKCCRSQRRHSFKTIQTPQTKLKTFDKWIRIIFVTLVILAILVVKLVLHLRGSQHATLHVVDLTQNNDNNPLNPTNNQRIGSNKFAHLVTNIKPNQIASNIDVQTGTNTVPSLGEQHGMIQDAVEAAQNSNDTLLQRKEAKSQFNDWWQCSLLNSNSPKYIAYVELQQLRQTYIDSKLQAAHDISSVSNRINTLNKCTIFKEFDITTSKIIQWRPHKHELCPWRNTALFWTAMDGTHIGIKIRNMARESNQLDNNWMFEFKDHLPRNCVCPQNVLFLYINNINENNMFKHSMDKCDEGCLVFSVTAQQENVNAHNDFHQILEPLLRFIDNKIAMKLDVEYIMVVSGDDTTLMLEDFEMDSSFDFGRELLDRFMSYDCDMLICGAANSYPHWQRKEQAFENNVGRWSRHHQHVNSNIFMVSGGIHNFTNYVKLIKSNFDGHDADEAKWNFQAAIRELHHQYYPKIKIDSLAKIWTRVDEWMCDP